MPGRPKRLRRCSTCGRDDAEILGHQRAGAALFDQRRQQRLAGGRLPVAVHGGGSLARDVPAGLETAEMIDAHEIEALALRGDAPAPPGEAVARHHVPGVVRVAPALAIGTEIIRRHPGHRDRLPLGIEQEQLARRPHVGTVVRHEDRHVAEQAHAMSGRVVPERAPLLREGVLLEAQRRDPRRQRRPLRAPAPPARARAAPAPSWNHGSAPRASRIAVNSA